jgi:hypothetical protein
MPTITLDASPHIVNIVGVVVGDDFIRTIRLHDVDFSGYTFDSDIDDNGTIRAVTISNIAFSSPDTTFVFKIDKTVTTELSPGSDYEYDIQWTDPSGNVRTMWQGTISTLPEVTT